VLTRNLDLSVGSQVALVAWSSGWIATEAPGLHPLLLVAVAMGMGMIMGGINGYLIAGTVWYYLDKAGYPFPNIIIPPSGEFATKIATIMNYMPPHVLGEPAIYFASTIVLIFILVVYV
jgi:hypothetical protein